MQKTVYPPWQSLTPPTLYESLKIIIATVTLVAPMRFLLIWVLLTVGWLLTIPVKPSIERYRSGRIYKRLVVLVIRFGCRLILFVAGFYWIETRGRFDRRANVIISTHQSLWDALWVIWSTGASQTAKADLFNMPIIRGFLFAIDSVPVDRHSRKGKREALAAIRTRAESKGSSPLLIFPTAICSNGRQLPEFKRGAFDPKVPVQPIGIAYPSRFYDHTLGRWILWELYRSTCQVINFMTITILPVRSPTHDEKSDSQLWTNNVRYEMSVHLGMQLVAYSFETDCVRIRCRSKNIVFNETKCLIHNLPLSLAVVDAFASLDEDKDGWIGGEDAATAGISFLHAYRESFNQLKLPPIPRRSFLESPENINAWMDMGITGMITGGRPRLPARKTDMHRQDFIEVAEVITYFNKLYISRPQTKPCPILAEVFDVSEYSHCPALTT